MKTFIIEATFEDHNGVQCSIIIGKTLAKDSIEAYTNMCRKYNTQSVYSILRLLGHESANHVEFFYIDLDEIETI